MKRFYGVYAAAAVFLLLFPAKSAAAGDPAGIAGFRLPDISASGGLAVVPYHFWHSGNFSGLTADLPSFLNPTSPGKMTKLLDIDMDATATSIYEGDLWFKKLGLTLGLNVGVDDNFIGRFNRVMGYLGYRGYALRLQNSRLRGSLEWKGNDAGGLIPASDSFNNTFTSVDILHYPDAEGVDLYIGIGYTTYRIPAQLEALIADGGDVRYGEHVYQRDLGIRVYSFLFGLDSLQSTFLGSPGTANFGEGFRLWAATQDRFGFGFARISAEAENWIETANGRSLRDNGRFITAADFNLTLGVQWVGRAGPARLGSGLGYTLSGQVVSTLPAWFDPVSRADQVEASPNLFLLSHGVIFKLIASW